jgi:hypothetical protein
MEKMFAEADFEFRSTSRRHVCKVIDGVQSDCRCCDCDVMAQPPQLQSMGSGWFWIQPPFLDFGGGANYKVQTLAQCEQACVWHKKCVTGTFVTSFDGKGQCWLSAKVAAKGERCVEQCESFHRRSADGKATEKKLRAFDKHGDA